ncbi:hypothetical protein ABZ464_07030 [Streptomyces sp. NPDC005820]
MTPIEAFGLPGVVLSAVPLTAGTSLVRFGTGMDTGTVPPLS